MYHILIDNVPIPQADIINQTIISAEKTEFDFANLIAAKASITLNLLNDCRDKYDDEVSGSLFYGASWYNLIMMITDLSTGLVVFHGRIRNIKKTDKDGKLIVEAVNFVKDIIDTTCVISLGESTDKTPSEIIYYIMADIVGIPEAFINKTSFNYATATQSANSGYIIAKYTSENNVKCSAVINEILRITSSRLYSLNNLLCYSVIPIYDGDPYLQIDESQIIAGTYQTEFNTENIYNSYKVAYKSSTSVLFATPGTTPDYITYSQGLYGVKTFTVPDQDVESTLAADFKLLCKTSTSAAYYGSVATALGHMARKIVKFDVRKSLGKLVLLNNGVDITYRNLINEPVRITERDLSKPTIMSLTGEFMNRPYELVIRDQLKPDPVALLSVKCFVNDIIELQWTPSDDAGLYGYRIEFSKTMSDFNGEFSDQGFSPVFLIATSTDQKDGMCYYQLSGLEDGLYYFKIRVVDSARNISNDSNIISYAVSALAAPAVDVQSYHTTGDLLTGLDFMDGVGTLPSGYSTYDDDTYDDVNYTYSAVYISGIYSNSDSFQAIKIKSTYTADVYDISYRSYNNGIYGSWITMSTGIEDGVVSYSATGIDAEYIQFRVLFDLPNMYEDFTVQISEVN